MAGPGLRISNQVTCSVRKHFSQSELMEYLA